MIPVDQINTTAGTQTRINIDELVVAEYAERMQEGDIFPPVVVFHDGNGYYLADGFHRVMAASRLNLEDIDADVQKGTRQDAVWYALGANKRNGKRMEPGDKRNAILIALHEFPEKSQQEIAEQVGCAQSYVNRIKTEANITSDNCPSTRIDSAGRIMPTSYAKPKPEPTEPECTSTPKEDNWSVKKDQPLIDPAFEKAWNDLFSAIKNLKGLRWKNMNKETALRQIQILIDVIEV